MGGAAVYSPPAPCDHAMKTEEENDVAHTGFFLTPSSCSSGGFVIRSQLLFLLERFRTVITCSAALGRKVIGQLWELLAF